MMKPPVSSYDPGLTQKFDETLRRAINKDGTFNVRRTGGGLHSLNFYQYLISASWLKFLGIVLVAYVLLNAAFAELYLLAGIRHLQGADARTPAIAFLSAFFFSVHTFTTVGYGSISPVGVWTNLISTVEALTGLLSFGVAAGLMYGRFARPSAKLAYSDRALIAPYRGGTSLQFRVANLRNNLLMELEASVMLMTVEKDGGRPRANYVPLNLERTKVLFFPLTWTIVHPIEEASPLYGRTPEDLKASKAEVIILVKGFDDTFSQVVHSRYSYRYDEIEWGAKFVPAFHIDSNGDVVVQVDHISDIEKVEVPPVS